jgi:hypothetical protein
MIPVKATSNEVSNEVSNKVSMDALNELALSSYQSFRQLGYRFLPSRGIRCEYSSRIRKPNEIHRGCAGKTRAFRTRCDYVL